MKTTSGSTTASLSNLPKTYMTHVLYPIFQEKSTENGLRYVRGLQVKLIDGDNVNQAKYHKWVRQRRQPVIARQRVRQNYQKHIWHMFYIQFFKRNRLRIVSDISEASTSCPSTSTTSTRPIPSSGYVIFSKTHMAHVYIQFFKRNHWEWSQICQRPSSHAH